MIDAGRPPITGKALMSGCAHQSMSHLASPPQSSLSLWGRSLAAAGSVSDTCSCPPCRLLPDISALSSAMSCLHICTPTAHTSLFLFLSHKLQSQGARVPVEVYLTLLACPPQCLWEQPDRLGPPQTAYACNSQEIVFIRQIAAQHPKTHFSISSVQQIRQARKCFTFAICFTLMTYLASSVPGLMIFVHLATCNSDHDFRKGTDS